jgi:hypothetical protein
VTTSVNPYAPPQAPPSGPPPLVTALAIEGTCIALDYELVIADLVNSSLRIQRDSPSQRRQFYAVWIVFAALIPLLIFLVGWTIPEDEIRWLVWLIGGGVSLLAAVFFPVWHRWKMKKILERMYGEGSNANLVGPRRIVLQPEFVVVSSPLWQMAFRWIAVEQITIEDDALCLSLSRFQPVIVPRRAFTDEAQLQSFAHAARDMRQRVRSQ